MRRQAVELLVLDARAGVILASHGGSDEERRKALHRAVSRLDVAEQIDAPLPSVLFSDRAGYHAALGDEERAASDRDRAARLAPSTSEDLTMLGTSLLASGDLAGAESALRSGDHPRRDRAVGLVRHGTLPLRAGPISRGRGRLQRLRGARSQLSPGATSTGRWPWREPAVPSMPWPPTVGP